MRRLVAGGHATPHGERWSNWRAKLARSRQIGPRRVV